MRTKKQIVNDYKEYLVSKGQKVSELTDDDLFETLIEVLYDTELVGGKKVSSVKAWFHFINFVLRYYVGTADLLWNPFVKEVFEIVEHNNLVCLESARGSGKSSILTIFYPIFKMFLFEGTDILLCANVPRTAKRNFRKWKKFIEQNEVLKSKIDKEQVNAYSRWGSAEAEYNGGLIETIGVGGTVRGAHTPLVIGDDLLRDDNKVSPLQVREFVLGQLYPGVISGNGRMIIIGTPLFSKDLFHELMNSKHDFQGKKITWGGVSAKGFFCKSFPAITDYKTKKVGFPWKYDWDKLMMIRNTVGELRFAKEFLLKILTDELCIFPESMIRKCIDSRLKWLSRGEKGKVYVIGADLATSASKRADFTCFVVIEYDPDTKVKLVREIVNAKMTAEQQERELVSLASKFNNAFVYIEKNNMGEFLRQKLVEQNVDVEGFTTNRVSKQNFIRFLRTEFANRRIFFPPLEEQYEVVKTQLLSFGYKELRGVQVMEALSGHDDIVSALSAANKATQMFERDDSVAIFI